MTRGHVLPLCLLYLFACSASSSVSGMRFFCSVMDHAWDEEAAPVTPVLAWSAGTLRLPSTLSLLLILSVNLLESLSPPLAKSGSEII